MSSISPKTQNLVHTLSLTSY